jgi:hypothetical protein
MSKNVAEGKRTERVKIREARDGPAKEGHKTRLEKQVR